MLIFIGTYRILFFFFFFKNPYEFSYIYIAQYYNTVVTTGLMSVNVQNIISLIKYKLYLIAKRSKTGYPWVSFCSVRKDSKKQTKKNDFGKKKGINHMKERSFPKTDKQCSRTVKKE